MSKLAVPILVDWESIESYMALNDIFHVVRCKDCRYHEDEQPGMVYCPATVGGWVDDDWFCKDGERSGGDWDEST